MPRLRSSCAKPFRSSPQKSSAVSITHPLLLRKPRKCWNGWRYLDAWKHQDLSYPGKATFKSGPALQAPHPPRNPHRCYCISVKARHVWKANHLPQWLPKTCHEAEGCGWAVTRRPLCIWNCSPTALHSLDNQKFAPLARHPAFLPTTAHSDGQGW